MKISFVLAALFLLLSARAGAFEETGKSCRGFWSDGMIEQTAAADSQKKADLACGGRSLRVAAFVFSDFIQQSPLVHCSEARAEFSCLPASPSPSTGGACCSWFTGPSPGCFKGC